MLAWRAGRAEIIARRSAAISAEPGPGPRWVDQDLLPLGVIEHAWHQQGRPNLDNWGDREGEFGGDQAAQTAWDALVVASRSLADDESSPTEMAELAVRELDDLPRFLWAL